MYNLTSSIIAAISAFHPLRNSTLLLHRTTATPGTGPYLPTTTTTPLLPSHTIYRPSDLSSVTGTVPVIIWGNNKCTSEDGDAYANLNTELASWGMMVLTCGDATSALSFLADQAGKEQWQKIGTEVGMLGTSCAGASLFEQGQDPRILSLAIMDTKGAVVDTEDIGKVVANMTKPVFWLSSSADATSQGETRVKMDYNAMAKGVPAWYGVLPGTDAQILDEGSAGKMGRAARFWAQWMVDGNETASEFFTSAAGAESEGWTVMRKGMDVLIA